MGKLFFFHPEYFGEYGVIVRKNIVERNKYEIVVIPTKTETVKGRQLSTGTFESTKKFTTSPEKTFTIPIHSLMTSGDDIIVLMNPQTQEFWLTVQHLHEIGLGDFKDLSAYGTLMNQNNVYQEAVHNFRRSSVENTEKINAFEANVAHMEGKVSLLTVENRSYRDTIQLLREGIIDVESRMQLYRTKMDGIASMYLDAEDMMTSGLSQLGESLHKVFSSTVKMMNSQEEIIIRGVGKRGDHEKELKNLQDKFKKELKDQKDHTNKIMTTIVKEMDKIKKAEDKEPRISESTDI